jgi:CheY-like chemotaxis protein
MELEKAAFYLHDVVARCSSVMLPSIIDKGLELKVNEDRLYGTKVVGDSVRLYQVIMNLLSNAVKFTSDGAVKLSVVIKDDPDEASAQTTVYFEIVDSGIGMSQEQAAKVFDPFTQADSSTTRIYGGSGLGLSITKNIVEMMGGTLTVDSIAGQGSAFSFELTFDTVESDEEEYDEDAKGGVLEKPRFEALVLVCDDNLMNQRVAYDHLENVGLRVVLADNGKIAVEKVFERKQNGEKPFDLIFMDIFMPVMDGLEAATRISELKTGTPIVAMTANVMKNELENYKKHAMPDCLGKPFTTQEMWRMLLKYLNPISSQIINEEEYARSDNELRHKMRLNFIKNNQDIYEQIKSVISAGDIKSAHRLAHTLKGNAGHIGESRLQKAAATVEELLKDGSAPVGSSLKLLKAELQPVIKKLLPLLEKEMKSRENNRLLDAGQALELLNKIEPMLHKGEISCLEYLDDILGIPGAHKLAEQMELIDFELACVTIDKLKKEIGANP